MCNKLGDCYIFPLIWITVEGFVVHSTDAYQSCYCWDSTFSGDGETKDAFRVNETNEEDVRRLTVLDFLDGLGLLALLLVTSLQPDIEQFIETLGEQDQPD